MNLLPSPFNFTDRWDEDKLEYFTSIVNMNEYGDFEGYKKLDYISDYVERVLDPDKDPLDKSDDIMEKYIGGIKRNKKRQKNAKVKKELNIVQQSEDDDSWEGRKYGTIFDNAIVLDNDIADTVERSDTIKYSLERYEDLKEEFKREEGVDLDTVIVRALEGVPKAVSTLADLVERYKFLGGIVEDVLTARENGYDILPVLD